jgi:hypothetical protein
MALACCWQSVYCCFNIGLVVPMAICACSSSSPAAISHGKTRPTDTIALVASEALCIYVNSRFYCAGSRGKEYGNPVCPAAKSSYADEFDPERPCKLLNT